jgi:hypothetical protein
MTKPKILLLDIETSYLEVKTWGIRDQYIDLAIKRCDELHKAQREVIRAQQDQLLQAMKTS